MQTCPRCHNPIDANSLICANCGTNLSERASSLVQPSASSPSSVDYAKKLSPSYLSSPLSSFSSHSVPSSVSPPSSAIQPDSLSSSYSDSSSTPPSSFSSSTQPYSSLGSYSSLNQYSLQASSPQNANNPQTNYQFTILEKWLGVSEDPRQVQPTNAVQKFFLAYAQQMATNPIAGAVAGAISTIVAGTILTLIIDNILNSLLGTVNNPLSWFPGPTANIFTLYILLHGPISIYSLTFFILIPVISGILGGYISAATDYSNTVRFAVGRATIMGPLYGLLLGIIGVMTGVQSYSGHDSVFLPIFLYCGLLATISGMIGGLIKVYGPHTWRADALALLVRKPRLPFAAGITGGLAGVGLGVVLTIPFIVLIISIDLFLTGIPNILGGTGDSNTLWKQLIDGLLSSPSLIISVLSLASGSSVGSNQALGDIVGGNQKNSLLTIPSQSLSIGTAWDYVIYVIVFIPIIAYFYGGRMAARVAGAKDRLRSGVTAGITSALVMALLTYMAQIKVEEATGSVDILRTFLGTLAFGLVFSTLGALLYRSPKKIKTRSAARGLLYTALVFAVIDIGGFVALIIVSPQLVALFSLGDLTTIYANAAGLLLAIPVLFTMLALVTSLNFVPQTSFDKHQEMQTGTFASKVSSEQEASIPQ
jgi:hypothetical protein